jgi:uncharacterized protein (TIGR02271 family)
MTTQKTTLVAVYDDYATAQKAQNDLIQSGFSKQDVQVTSNGERAVIAGSASYTEETGKHEGGIAGFFHNLFGSHDDSAADRDYYSDAVSRGGAVVTVTVDEEKADAATTVLNRYNPTDVDEQFESAGAETAPLKTNGKSTGDRVIPVVQEEMQVGKRSVQSGGVRVYSRITEQPVTESVSLHEERARVERRPVNRAATEADFRLKDEVVEVIETSEEAVVGKTARVVEEVVVGRDASDRTETIKDTVRRTDVEVERIDPEVRQDFRKDYDSRFAVQGADYDTYEPAYGFGYGLSSDARFQGKDWGDVEESAKTDYLRTNPNSAWDKVSNAVKYGWDKSTGKR